MKCYNYYKHVTHSCIHIKLKLNQIEFYYLSNLLIKNLLIKYNYIIVSYQNDYSFSEYTILKHFTIINVQFSSWMSK